MFHESWKRVRELQDITPNTGAESPEIVEGGPHSARGAASRWRGAASEIPQQRTQITSVMAGPRTDEKWARLGRAIQ